MYVSVFFHCLAGPHKTGGTNERALQLIYSASLLGELASLSLKLATREYQYDKASYQIAQLTRLCEHSYGNGRIWNYKPVKCNIKGTKEPMRHFISTDPLVSSNESCPLCLQVLL